MFRYFLTMQPSVLKVNDCSHQPCKRTNPKKFSCIILQLNGNISHLSQYRSRQCSKLNFRFKSRKKLQVPQPDSLNYIRVTIIHRKSHALIAYSLLIGSNHPKLNEFPLLFNNCNHWPSIMCFVLERKRVPSQINQSTHTTLTVNSAAHTFTHQPPIISNELSDVHPQSNSHLK